MSRILCKYKPPLLSMNYIPTYTIQYINKYLTLYMYMKDKSKGYDCLTHMRD